MPDWAFHSPVLGAQGAAIFRPGKLSAAFDASKTGLCGSRSLGRRQVRQVGVVTIFYLQKPSNKNLVFTI